MDQDEKVTWISTQGEMESVRAALERMLSHPDPDIREGDSSAPTNPRRLQMLLEKLKDIQASFQETPKTQPH
jgi:3-deoxy-D-manno-octulosonic acid (KDO) 8-phosphate synthase